jgi:hypothetical protein
VTSPACITVVTTVMAADSAIIQLAWVHYL